MKHYRDYNNDIHCSKRFDVSFDAFFLSGLENQWKVGEGREEGRKARTWTFCFKLEVCSFAFLGSIGNGMFVFVFNDSGHWECCISYPAYW